MEVIYPCCCGLDVHKKSITACRSAGPRPARRDWGGAEIFGRCARQNGIQHFDGLIAEVMALSVGQTCVSDHR